GPADSAQPQQPGPEHAGAGQPAEPTDAARPRQPGPERAADRPPRSAGLAQPAGPDAHRSAWPAGRRPGAARPLSHTGSPTGGRRLAPGAPRARTAARERDEAPA